MTTTTTHQQSESVDLDRLEALAKAALQQRKTRTIISDAAQALSRECSPETILALIAQARASQPSAASDAQPGADQRTMRCGAYVMDFARRIGWPDDGGEGAFEFVTRRFYEEGQDNPSPRAALTTPAASGHAGATVAAEFQQGKIAGLEQACRIARDHEAFNLPVADAISTQLGMEQNAAPASPATQAADTDARDRALELLREADELLWIASGAMLKMGLRDRGSDCSLSHEVRKFALEFSNDGRDGPGVLQVRGTGRYCEWLTAVRKITFPAMSASVSEADGSGKGGAA